MGQDPRDFNGDGDLVDFASTLENNLLTRRMGAGKTWSGRLTQDGTFTQFNERHKEAWLCNDYNYRDTRRAARPHAAPVCGNCRAGVALITRFPVFPTISEVSRDHHPVTFCCGEKRVWSFADQLWPKDQVPSQGKVGRQATRCACEFGNERLRPRLGQRSA